MLYECSSYSYSYSYVYVRACVAILIDNLREQEDCALLARLGHPRVRRQLQLHAQRFGEQLEGVDAAASA